MLPIIGWNEYTMEVSTGIILYFWSIDDVCFSYREFVRLVVLIGMIDVFPIFRFFFFYSLLSIVFHLQYLLVQILLHYLDLKECVKKLIVVRE